MRNMSETYAPTCWLQRISAFPPKLLPDMFIATFRSSLHRFQAKYLDISFRGDPARARFHYTRLRLAVSINLKCQHIMSRPTSSFNLKLSASPLYHPSLIHRVALQSTSFRVPVGLVSRSRGTARPLDQHRVAH